MGYEKKTSEGVLERKIQLDLSKEYGLVLEGGGARGSFQIGVWKALKESGVKIKGVSGVSVGALNGAMICMDDLEKAERIWEDIDFSTVMEIDEDIKSTLKRVVIEKGFDITPLKKLLRETVDEEKIRQSHCELYATTYSLTDKRLLHVDVKALPEGEIEDILLASSYLPVFKSEKLGGKWYTDGGGFNNVPLDVLVEKGYKDIIVIRIYGMGLDRERKVKIPEDTHVYHIAPLEDLGGVLEFDKKRSRKNMVLGYLEAKRFLYGLAGRRYYIDAPEKELCYFNKMMSEPQLLNLYRTTVLKEEKAADSDSCRFYTEKLLPVLAKKLKQKDGWDYRDLYVALLEALAQKNKVLRYRVYTVDELLKEVYKQF